MAVLVGGWEGSRMCGEQEDTPFVISVLWGKLIVRLQSQNWCVFVTRLKLIQHGDIFSQTVKLT